MNNQKIVGKIATAFGAAFAVFAALTAILNYEAISIQYGTGVPASYVIVGILSAMLPFMLFAALSFIVASVISRAEKAPVKIEETQEEQATETKPETSN
jgi:large-conductance mechanosensitive channel